MCSSIISISNPRLKMILKGMCNVIFFSSVIFILVLFSESNLFHHVLAQMSEMNDDRVVLKTMDAGSFIGQRKHLSETVMPSDPNELPRTYFSFRGIPYSKPPVGTELRWKEPQTVEVRRHPKVATDYTPVCSQWDPVKRRVIGTQDCLYLSISTPYVPSTVRRPAFENMTSWTVENRNLLAVIVYIHGGEGLSGSGNINGERFMKENVVLVTLKYRLGIFGFLSNGDTSLPGNYGLLDQIKALEWVKQNIYRFGGNPTRVTIFGNIEYLLMTPMAKGLFHAGIFTPSSTSLLGPFKNIKSPKELTISVAKAAGCPMEIQEEMIECLKITEVDRLIRIQHKLLKFFSYPSQGIGPIVDKEWQEFPVLPDKPESILEDGKFANVPLMIGVSAYEGFNPFFEFYVKLGQNRTELMKDQGFVKERLQSTLEVILGVDNVEDGGREFDRIFESIWRYYFGGIDSKHWETEQHRVLWKLFRVFGDLTMQSGHRKFLQLISSKMKAPVFNYVFNYSIDHFPDYLEKRLKSLGNKERDVDRTLHSSGIPPWKELYYLFEPLDMDNSTFSKKNSTEEVKIKMQSLRNFTQEDEKLSEFLVKLWISFANYGSPKQVISKLGHGRWQRMSDNSLNYYVIGSESYAMKMDFRKAESLFWMSILPQIRELSEKIAELEPFPLLFWIFVGLTSALILITLLLMIMICCSRTRGTTFGEDNVVFLNRIPAE